MGGVKMELLLRNKWLIKSLVRQNFSLLFDAIDSEKLPAYVKRHVKFFYSIAFA